jgi:hypothetical protein
MEYEFSWGDFKGTGEEAIEAVSASSATMVRSVDIAEHGRRALPAELQVFGEQ